MRKRLAVIGLVLAAGLGAAALAGGGMDGLFPPDPAEGLPVVTLAEGPEGLSLHLYSYEYTLTELLREESFYTDGVLQPTDRGAQHAYRGTMLHRQLEPVYALEGVPAGDYLALSDHTGQAFFHLCTAEWDLAGFFGKDREALRLYAVRDGAAQRYSLPDIPGWESLPGLAVWDGRHCCVLLTQVTAAGETAEPRLLLAVLDPAAGSFTTVPAELAGSAREMFLWEGEAWLLLENGADWELARVDLATGETKRSLLSREEVDFFLRDGESWCWGSLAGRGRDASRLTVHTAPLGETAGEVLELEFPAPFGAVEAARYEAGRLWLGSYVAESERLPAKALLEVDLGAGELVRVVPYGEKEQFSTLRFMEEGEDGRLIDLPYASCR